MDTEKQEIYNLFKKSVNQSVNICLKNFELILS